MKGGSPCRAVVLESHAMKEPIVQIREVSKLYRHGELDVTALDHV
jgi:hypothetical protein